MEVTMSGTRVVTISGFVETVVGVVVGGVNVDSVTERLQAEGCVNDESFGAT